MRAMMTCHRRCLARLDAKWRMFIRKTIVGRFVRLLTHRITACAALTAGNHGTGYHGPRRHGYRHLKSYPASPLKSGDVLVDPAGAEPPLASDAHDASEAEADVVPIKISLLGDCRVGKTSFMNKYIGSGEQDEQHKGLGLTGLNTMNKVLVVKGARIAYTIWDVAGDRQFVDHVPIACRDAAAILIMFDLMRRCTLNNSMVWYRRARKWNKTAIPVLIGTKFDDFIQLPLVMQWTVVNQARAYARAMNATLFFTSTTYNINVNKIFKFLTAKLFNLPWKMERNLTIGEPIVDF